MARPKKEPDKVRIRYTASMATPEMAIRPGDEMEVDAEEANRLIAANFAVPAPKPGEGRRQATA